jgi:GTPase SAR1 family protein
MTPMFFKDAHGVIMVCDLTDRSSLMGLRDWLKLIRDHAPEHVGRAD